MDSEKRLEQLAAKIRAAHGRVLACLRRSVKEAIYAGQWLTEAQKVYEGKAWKKWVPKNTGVSHRTACRYVQLFKYKKYSLKKCHGDTLKLGEGLTEAFYIAGILKREKSLEQKLVGIDDPIPELGKGGIKTTLPKAEKAGRSLLGLPLYRVSPEKLSDALKAGKASGAKRFLVLLEAE